MKPSTGDTATPAASKAPPIPSQRKYSNGNGEDHDELRELLAAMQAMRSGDFTVRMDSHSAGLLGKIADSFNDIVAANQRMAQQLEHVGKAVGRDGQIRQRVKLDLQSGSL